MRLEPAARSGSAAASWTDTSEDREREIAGAQKPR